MPRDLSTYSRRLRSPPSSMSRSSSQVSISEEMPASVCLRGQPPLVRLVNSAVICPHLEEVDQAHAASRRLSRSVPAAMKLVIGSTTTSAGWKSRTCLCMVARCISRPETVGRAAWNRSRPFSIQRLEVEADGAHVAHDLARRLLEGEVEAALAAPAGGVGEVGGQAGLAGARRARRSARCCPR